MGRTTAPTVPPCSRLGVQCHSVPVTLRVGTLENGPGSLDHEATWLLGHTEHITFTDLWEGEEEELYADAVLHVPCKYLRRADGRASCSVYGYEGPDRKPVTRIAQPRRLGGSRFRIVDEERLVARTLPAPAPAPRALPIVEPQNGGGNPCATAPCRTSDLRRGAACCRDLQVEIMCTTRQRRLEALVRSRRSPYLCKVQRAGDYSIEAELISACAYLEPGGVNCTLHGRQRADGRPAKPELCSAWPERKKGLHPGCVFARPRRRAAPAR